MTKERLFGLLVIGALIVVIIFQHSCSGKATTKPKADTVKIGGDTKYVHVHDTSFLKPDVVYIHGKGTNSRDTVYVKGETIVIRDTLKALQDYISTKLYKDSFRSNEVFGTIWDSVRMNKIVWRDIQIKNSRPKQIITPPAPQKVKIYLGGQLGLATDLKDAVVAPSIMLQTKNDQIYTGSYDFVSKSVIFGSYFKIHLGK